MFTPETKQILLETIFKEQMDMLNRNEYDSERYIHLEKIKVKIKECKYNE